MGTNELEYFFHRLAFTLRFSVLGPIFVYGQLDIILSSCTTQYNFVITARLPYITAKYWVAIEGAAIMPRMYFLFVRPSVLSLASFRFHRTMDTLAMGYAIRAIRTR